MARTWRLAQKTPPIWTVRILRLLNKRSWSPAEDEQLSFFEELSRFVGACNEYDLPGPDLRAPITQAATAGARMAAARVTADGEFLFLMDDSGSVIEVRRISDMGTVERIRLDMIAGKQYATLAFDVSADGSYLAALSDDPKSKQSFIHLFELLDGEVISDQWCKLECGNLGLQVSRLAFDSVTNALALYSGIKLVTIFDIDTMRPRAQFTVISSTTEQLAYSAITIADNANAADWLKYGRRCVGEVSARALALVDAGQLVVARRGDEVAVSTAVGELLFHVQCRTGIYAVSKDGCLLSLLEGDGTYLVDLKSKEEREIAYCRDPLAKSQ